MQGILVGYDGSPPAIRALEAASHLAAALGASVTVLTAAADRLPETSGPAADDTEPGQRVAASGAVRARELGVNQVEARTSLEAPDDALVQAAAEGFDLVVVGHRSHGPVHDLLVGSTAKSVVDRLTCSVLVVR